MGRLFAVSLEGKVYSCKHCRTHLSLCDDIVSKVSSLVDFSDPLTLSCAGVISHLDMGRLISSVRWIFGLGGCPSHVLISYRVNVSVGEMEERMMTTGMHTVGDIFCVGCGSIVGWTYETAHEKTQKYKEGKSVLERSKITSPDGSDYWVSHEAQAGGSDSDDD